MATEQILLSSSAFDGMRETGGFGQPLHTLYPQIRAVLTEQLGADAAALLAEPVVDRVRGRIDWYTEGDPEQQPVAFDNLPEDQRRVMLARIEEILGRGRELAERYTASGNAQRIQLGAILKGVLVTPAASGILLVAGRPVITGWGFAPDRPWETPEGSGAGPAPLPIQTAEPFRDIAIPEIALPELASAPLEPLPESPAPSTLPESAPPALPEASFATAPTGESAPSLSEPKPRLKPESAPAIPAVEPLLKSSPESAPIMGVEAVSPVAETAPAAPFHYVVIGSRYFWTVALLAVLLVLGAGLWTWLKKPALYPMVGDPAAGALTVAQDTETGLRVRLEVLLAQLAKRRGQCSLLPGSAAAPASPRRESSSNGRAIPGQSAIPATGAVTVPMNDDRTPPVLSTTAASTTDRAALPEAAIPTDLATTSLALSGRNSGDTPIGVTPGITPAAPDRMTPGGQNPPAEPNSALAKPAPRAPAASSSTEPPARTLEEALLDRRPATAPVRPLPPVEPPVRAAPTPEERQEFVNRLSAAGAATGEITAALLWNSRSDLDLVVRCPAGRQLDYQHPAECGGALDVDANAVRDQLRDRPVENAFWPAGKIEPGVYEIAVRYAPRKDEINPGETPFQVRLIRGGQESVFKGTVRPNTTVPVSTFTVER
ncbi:MAG: hypothetical protein ACOYMW_06630 [Candidatus Competibacteraceae bacterium]